MPKILETYEFKSRGSSEGTYDWNTLMDGKTYQLFQGEDYNGKTIGFQSMARNEAARRGLGIRVSMPPAAENDGVESVVIMAYTLSDEQKTAREARRIARKAAKDRGEAVPSVEGDSELDDVLEAKEEAPAPEPEPIPEPVPEPVKPAATKFSPKKGKK